MPSKKVILCSASALSSTSHRGCNPQQRITQYSKIQYCSRLHVIGGTHDTLVALQWLLYNMNRSLTGSIQHLWRRTSNVYHLCCFREQTVGGCCETLQNLWELFLPAQGFMYVQIGMGNSCEACILRAS